MRPRMSSWILESHSFGQGSESRFVRPAGVSRERVCQVAATRPQPSKPLRRADSEPRRSVVADATAPVPRASNRRRAVKDDFGTSRKLFSNSELDSPRRQPYLHYLYSSNPRFTTNNAEYGKFRSIDIVERAGRVPFMYPDTLYSHILCLWSVDPRNYCSHVA